jgi:hypothetical protein
LHDLQSSSQSIELENNRYKRLESNWEEIRADLESRLALEVAQRQNTQSSLREFEMRHKIEVQNLVESATNQTTQRELEIAKLKKELETARSANDVRNNSSNNNNSRRQKGSSSSISTSSTNGGRNDGGLADQNDNDGDESTFLGSDKQRNQNIGTMPGVLANGEVSFAANEKLQQRVRKREDDLRSLHNQVPYLPFVESKPMLD